MGQEPRIRLIDLRHSTRCDGGRPSSTNGVFDVVREFYGPHSPGMLHANQIASRASLWLALVASNSKARAK